MGAASNKTLSWKKRYDRAMNISHRASTMSAESTRLRTAAKIQYRAAYAKMKLAWETLQDAPKATETCFVTTGVSLASLAYKSGMIDEALRLCNEFINRPWKAKSAQSYAMLHLAPLRRKITRELRSLRGESIEEASA